MIPTTTQLKHIYLEQPIQLESGSQLSNVCIAYQTWGSLNKYSDNVVWVLHALTGNSDAVQWWPELVGEGKLFDPRRHFIICANMIGSCYGTRFEESRNRGIEESRTRNRGIEESRNREPGIEESRTRGIEDSRNREPGIEESRTRTRGEEDEKKEEEDHLITTRDVVNVFVMLADKLGIGTIEVLIGGSMGGQQALEWAVQQPNRIGTVITIAANAKQSAWGIAFNAAQRMAIESDPTFYSGDNNAGAAGLAAARAIGMLSYRTPADFHHKQSDDNGKIVGFAAESYQRYQGQKLVNRFSARSYHRLTRIMDSHDVGRGRGGVVAALNTIRAHTITVGIDSDLLFPTTNQKLIAEHVPDSQYIELSSAVGHDAFLSDQQSLASLLKASLTTRISTIITPGLPPIVKESSLNNHHLQQTMHASPLTINPFKVMNIGLFGFGCVGQGLWDVIHRTHGLRSHISRICVKDKSKPRPLTMEAFTFDKFDILNDDNINVVVELIDDADAAFDIVCRAMRNGKAVVTANKKMVATHFNDLLDLQKETQQPLLYEASTGGSIPIIRNLEEYYDNDLLSGVEGIVNGTTNYILSKLALEPGASYNEVLGDAQRLGFAESDPTLDIEGWDAAYKTAVISAHAFGVVIKPHQVVRRGIASITPFDVKAADTQGCKIKLLSKVFVNKGQLFAWALPTFVPQTDMLSRIVNETNAIRLHGAFSDDQLLVGKGAGAHPTASAVLSDIAALRYGYRYEYKKLSQEDIPTFTTEISTRVYIRGDDQSVNSIEFDKVETDHKTNDHRYLIANTTINSLINSKAFSSPDCFVAIV